ncbi:MAG: twin-arginine translocase TatA/TatE family subunit [Alphaproteobacteria bacterium]|nr:twin-arginine translocase TatA/TatE family subunit [Alphaproteobacteria bacterium]
MRLGWMEILVIVILLVILFGHRAIPSMMKNVADGINIFKKELKNTDKKDGSDSKKVLSKKSVKSKGYRKVKNKTQK